MSEDENKKQPPPERMTRRKQIEAHENVTDEHFAQEGWDYAKELLIDYLRSRQDKAMQDLDRPVRIRDLRAYELEILITALEAQQPVTMIGSIHREHREKSNEFFYTDESGRKRDLLLHADVLAEGEDAASFAKSLYPALRAQGYSDEDIRQALPELYDEMVARGLKPHKRSGRDDDQDFADLARAPMRLLALQAMISISACTGSWWRNAPAGANGRPAPPGPPHDSAQTTCSRSCGKSRTPGTRHSSARPPKAGR